MFAIDGDYDLPCKEDPELFFSNRKKDIARAKAKCQTCKIMLICLERTLETERDLGHQLHGVHAGLTKAERANTTLTRIDGTSINQGVASNDTAEPLAAVAGA